MVDAIIGNGNHFRKHGNLHYSCESVIWVFVGGGEVYWNNLSLYKSLPDQRYSTRNLIGG
jgi:hypothetical protein